MQAPKKKVSKSRKGTRRAHDFIVLNRPTTCSNCGELVSSHTVCRACGFYRGRSLLKVKSQNAEAATE